MALWWFIILEGSINLLWMVKHRDRSRYPEMNLSFLWPTWWNLNTRYGFILNWVCLSCVYIYIYISIICSIYIRILFHSFNTCFGLQCNLSSTFRSSLCLNHCEDLSPFGEKSILYTFCLYDYGVLMRSTKFDDVNDSQCKEIHDVTIPHCKVVGWPSSFAGFTYVFVILVFCRGLNLDLYKWFTVPLPYQSVHAHSSQYHITHVPLSNFNQWFRVSNPPGNPCGKIFRHFLLEIYRVERGSRILKNLEKKGKIFLKQGND